MYEQVNEMLSQTKPNVVITEYQMINTEEYQLKTNNFTFALALLDSRLQPIYGLGTIYNLTLNNCYRKRQRNPTTGEIIAKNDCTNYQIEQCDDNKHFITETQQQYFQYFNKTALYCISKQDWDQRAIRLQGAAQSNDFQFIEIQVKTCSNSSNYTQCANSSIIQTTLQQGYLIIHSNNLLAQMENSNMPFKTIIESQYYTFSLTNSKIIVSEQRITSTQTDIGLVQAQFLNHTNLQQSSISESNTIYNKVFIAQYSYMISQKTTLYKRSYIKLQTVAGSIGGLWQVMTLLLSVFLQPFIQFIARISLANQHFKFEESKAVNLEKWIQEKSKSICIQDPNPQGFQDQKIIEMDKVENEIPEISCKKSQRLQFEPLQQSSRLENSINIQKFLKYYTKKSYLQIKDIVSIFMGCGKLKKIQKRQLDFLVEKVMNKLDTSYIISKLQEIDKLKHILLSKEQLSLFNYFTTPVIPLKMLEIEFAQKIQLLQSKDAYKFLLEEEKTDEIKIEEAYFSYQKIMSKNKLPIIDQQILRYLDDDIKALFDKCVMNHQSQFDIQSGDKSQYKYSMSQIQYQDSIRE